MNEAVREHYAAADMRTTDEQQRLVAFTQHLLFDHPGEVRVTPIVHVVVGRAGDAGPVDGRIAEQHANSPLSGERPIEGADAGKEFAIDRGGPDAADLRRVLPGGLEGVFANVAAG